MILLVFFISKTRGGGYVRAAFPHLGLTKHTTWRPVPPLSSSVSHTPPFPPAPFVSCLCALCEPLSLLITITVHPPQVGKYNSIFLCALGNLYNSILNLNETIKNMLKNSSRETFMKKNNNSGEIGKSKTYVSLFLFFVWFQLFLLVFQEATLRL